MDCLKNITAADVVRAVESASKKIVFLAPGLDESVALALARAWQRLGPEAVTVVLDIDAEVVRLGYGTEKGLEEIQKAAASCNQAVCHQPGVRICVVTTDENSLIFTPTPLLIEAGSQRADRPNGIALKATPKELGDELGVGADGPAKREIGLEIVKADAVEAVKKDLSANPPLRFDISRKERVFNAKLEFVEFELEGCFISRHTVTIPPELVGMAKMDVKTRDKLRSSFRLVEKSDILDSKKRISEEALSKERNRIGKKFLVAIQGHGTVILRSNKDAFEKDVEELRTKVTNFRDALGANLAGIFRANAKRLTKALLPSVAKSPPEYWTSVLGANPDRKEIERQLEQAILRSFGEPEALLRDMRVSLKYKGVTYGTLTDADFIKKAAEAFPNLKLHDEYDASRGSAASLAPAVQKDFPSA